jgi:hypothetical protein
MTHREIYGKTVDLNADLITVNNRGSLTQVGQLGGSYNKSFFDVYQGASLTVTNQPFYWRYQLTGIDIWIPAINFLASSSTAGIGLLFQINNTSSDFPTNITSWTSGNLIFTNGVIENSTTNERGVGIVLPYQNTVASQLRNGLSILPTADVAWVITNALILWGFSYVELAVPF